MVIIRHYHTVHNALSNNHVHTLTCSCLCVPSGDRRIMCGVEARSNIIFPIFGHSAVQSFTTPSPSLSFHPDLRPPPLHVHDHRTVHARHSSWPSKPSWAQPLNVLTSGQVRTTQLLLTITGTHHRNSCYPSVFAFNHLLPIANLPLIHFYRSHRCPIPRRISVQLGTVDLSLGPPSPSH